MLLILLKNKSLFLSNANKIFSIVIIYLSSLRLLATNTWTSLSLTAGAASPLLTLKIRLKVFTSTHRDLLPGPPPARSPLTLVHFHTGTLPSFCEQPSGAAIFGPLLPSVGGTGPAEHQI